MSPELSPELMLEILSRLPVKSLLKFRCVSKLWLKSIDSSYFIEFHLKRSSIKSRKNKFLICTNTLPDAVKYVDLDHLQSSDVVLQNPLKSSPATPKSRLREIVSHFRSSPGSLRSSSENFQIIVPPWQGLGKPQPHMVQVWGSCNGLLLMADLYSACLWNPSTRKHLNLPKLDNGPSFRERGVDGLYGFGYDSARDDYKVIKVLTRENLIYQVWVYSLQSNSWTKVTRTLPHNMKCERQPGVLVQEALHWPVKNDGGEDGFILAFDLKTEEYRMFSQPKCRNTGFHSKLGALNGSLCLIYSYLPQGFEILVMREHGVEETWTRVNLRMGDFISYPGGFINLTLRDGKKSLLHNGGVDCTIGTHEGSFEVIRKVAGKRSDVCMVSLVSPHGCAASAEQQDEALN